MNALAVKVEMFEILSQTYDEALLMKLHKAMKEVFESEQADWWDELPLERQAKLKLAIEESDHEENLIDHEDIEQKHAKWLKLDAKKYSGAIKLSQDPLAYQKQIREEW